MISQVCPELPGFMASRGMSLAGDAAPRSSLPRPALQFPGADGDHVGSRESRSASALLCSEGAQTDLGNSQTPGKYLLGDAFREKNNIDTTTAYVPASSHRGLPLPGTGEGAPTLHTPVMSFLASQPVLTRRNFAA